MNPSADLSRPAARLGVLSRKLCGKIRSSLAFRDVLWMFVERIAVVVGSALSGILITRHLGPTLAGSISLAAGVQGLLGVVVLLGLENVVVRRLVEDPANGEKMVTSVWSAITITGAAAGAGVLVFLLVGGEFGTTEFALTAAAINLFLMRGLVLEWIFRSRSQMRILSRTRTPLVLAIQGLKITLALIGASYSFFIVLMMVEAVVLYYFLRFKSTASGIKLPSFRIEGIWNGLKNLLGESWPLLLTGLAVIIYAKVDVVMLQVLRGETEVGIYAAATRLSEVWHIIPSIISVGFFAKAVELNKSDHTGFKKYLLGITALFTAFPLLLAVSVQAMAPQIMQIIYGPKFQSSASSLQVHIWSCLPVFLGCILSQICLILKANKELLAGCIAGAVVNLSLNLWLIPKFGAVGAAQATVASYWCSIGLPFLLFPSLRSKLAGCLRGRLP